VFILNPIISLVCIGTLPLSEIVDRPNDVMTRMVRAAPFPSFGLLTAFVFWIVKSILPFRL
jgi:hypothetical protein